MEALEFDGANCMANADGHVRIGRIYPKAPLPFPSKVSDSGSGLEFQVRNGGITTQPNYGQADVPIPDLASRL